MEPLRIRDPIHGLIELNEGEAAIIKHEAFQRLRNIRQLALTYKVYPEATHTRFEHSLGVMHLASRMMAALRRRPLTKERFTDDEFARDRGRVDVMELETLIAYLASRTEIRGKKALQKPVYFCREAGVPVYATYRMHIYGPYSNEVAEESGEAVHFVATALNEAYGAVGEDRVVSEVYRAKGDKFSRCRFGRPTATLSNGAGLGRKPPLKGRPTPPGPISAGTRGRFRKSNCGG